MARVPTLLAWLRIRHRHLPSPFGNGLNYRQLRFVLAGETKVHTWPTSGGTKGNSEWWTANGGLRECQSESQVWRLPESLWESSWHLFLSRLAFIMRLFLPLSQVGLISPAATSSLFKSWLIFSIINIVCKYLCGVVGRRLCVCVCLCWSFAVSVSVKFPPVPEPVPVPELLLLLLPLVAFN